MRFALLVEHRTERPQSRTKFLCLLGDHDDTAGGLLAGRMGVPALTFQIGLECENTAINW